MASFSLDMSEDALARLSDQCLEQILWYCEEGAEALYRTGSKAIQELLSRTRIDFLDVQSNHFDASCAYLACFKRLHRLSCFNPVTEEEKTGLSHAGLEALTLIMNPYAGEFTWVTLDAYPSLTHLELLRVFQGSLKSSLAQKVSNALTSIHVLSDLYICPISLDLPPSLTKLLLSTIRVSDWERERTDLNEIIHRLSVSLCPSLVYLTLELGVNRSLENHANIKLESKRLEHLKLVLSFLHDFEIESEPEVDEIDDFADREGSLENLEASHADFDLGNDQMNDQGDDANADAEDAPDAMNPADIVRMPVLESEAHVFIRCAEHAGLKSLRLDLSLFEFVGSFPSNLTSLKLVQVTDTALKRQNISEWPSTLLTLVVRGASDSHADVFNSLPASLTHLELPYKFIDWVQLPPLLQNLVSDPASRFVARKLFVPACLALPPTLQTLDCPLLLLNEKAIRSIPQTLRYLRFGRRDGRCPEIRTVEISLPRTRIDAVNVNILW